MSPSAKMLKWISVISVAVIFLSSGVMSDTGNWKPGANSDGPIGDSVSNIAKCVADNGKDMINGLKEGILEVFEKLANMPFPDSVMSILQTSTGKLSGGDVKKITDAVGHSVRDVFQVGT
ncbi:hypothetical protein NPIL_104201 [Nephila pilipes]|uniref:Uncharacterized protein n=1 Tax=Nephila pilipes TaxID=299642 RepID=A0A8X6R3K9_NEPPI|nr:hypothetical protein NPIL_104201 [Nephila pilipes]